MHLFLFSLYWYNIKARTELTHSACFTQEDQAESLKRGRIRFPLSMEAPDDHGTLLDFWEYSGELVASSLFTANKMHFSFKKWNNDWKTHWECKGCIFVHFQTIHKEPHQFFLQSNRLWNGIDFHSDNGNQTTHMLLTKALIISRLSITKLMFSVSVAKNASCSTPNIQFSI